MDSSDASHTQLNQARETMDVLMEVSSLLNTGLDRETLSICVSLCEAGVNPEALAAVIKELRSEARAAAQAQQQQQQQQQQQPHSQSQSQSQPQASHGGGPGDRTSTLSWRA